MNHNLKKIAFAILFFWTYNSFSQANNGAGSSSKCTANCIFSSCTANCTATAGGAVCACPYGFAACGCGGYTPSKSLASSHQKENLDLMINHLESYTSLEGINLKIKMQEFRMLSDNPDIDLTPIADEIVNICESLNPYDKSRYNTFLLTLNP